MSEMSFKEARLYVGTYAKYNRGSIDGEWMNLADYADRDEFYEACKDLHADESDPEFMFQDYEYLPECMYCESDISEKYWEFLHAIEDNLIDEDAFFVWLSLYYTSYEEADAEDLVSKFEDRYVGYYESEEEFAESIVDDCYDIPDNLRYYFDMEKFARDLFMCDYDYDDGYVFRAY